MSLNAQIMDMDPREQSVIRPTYRLMYAMQTVRAVFSMSASQLVRPSQGPGERAGVVRKKSAMSLSSARGVAAPMATIGL